MNYHFRSAKITAPASSNLWGGCFVENGLIVLLEVSTDEQTIASHLGKSTFDKLSEKYENLSPKDKTAVKILLSEISGNPFIKTALIGINQNSELFLGCLGKGQAVLARRDKIAAIVSGGFVSQGQIQQDDRIIFHSDRLADILGVEDLNKIYQTKDLEHFEEELAGRLSTDQSYAGCAVLEIQVAGKRYIPDNNLLESAEPAKKFIKIISQKLSSIPVLNRLKNLPLFNPRIARRKRALLSIVTFLVIVILLNSFFGFFHSLNSKKAKKLNQSLSTVKSQYEEAQTLLDLNPVRSRELLGSAKLTVSELLKDVGKNSSEYKILTDWFNKISVSEITAYKIYKLTAVPLFFDISLVKTQGVITSVSSYQEDKVILDSVNKAVYFLDTSTKQSAVLAGADTVKDARVVAIHGNYAYFLNSSGIYRIDLEKKSPQKVIEADDKWGDIIRLEAFAGNLYLLDRKNNTIWKYIVTDTGFSSRISYINSGVTTNFANADQMAIDGSIWVGEDSSLSKFTSGNRDQFSLQGLADTITHFDSISTSDVDDNIYILDKALSRIIVFDKDGLYHSQYQWDELKNANSIIADEKEGKIFVFFKDKIYAIDIK